MLKWVVLGSGCFSPEPGEMGTAIRNPAGHALVVGRDILLFDLGFGNLGQMFRAGLDPARATHLFFSHRHPDHVGDLPALLFYYRYARKPSGGRLHVCGPRGFTGFFQRLEKAHHPWLKPRGFEIKISELEERDVVNGGDWRVLCREVPHSTEAIAFRWEGGRRSVCYSGDTGFDSGFPLFAQRADLLVLECSLPDGAKNANHLQVSQSLQLIKTSGAKRNLLTHLSRASFQELSKRTLGPKIRIASDLMQIRIG